jgi:hypothetical protein
MRSLLLIVCLVFSSLGLYACEDTSKEGACTALQPTGAMIKRAETKQVFDQEKKVWVDKEVEVEVPETSWVEVPCDGSVSTSESEEAEADQEAFEAACEKLHNISCKGVKPPEVATEE